MRVVIKEAVKTNQLQQKLNNTKLSDLHIDLESLDTVSEDVINDLVKKVRKNWPSNHVEIVANNHPIQ